MKKTFELPATPSCRVIYLKDGVSYAGVLNPTPKSNDELQQRMLVRHIGMGQIETLEPIQPPRDLQRNDPAVHQMSKYMRIPD